MRVSRLLAVPALLTLAAGATAQSPVKATTHVLELIPAQAQVVVFYPDCKSLEAKWSKVVGHFGGKDGLLELADDVPFQGGAVPRGVESILVADDQAHVLHLVKRVLEGAGYDVTTAVDGTDGASRLSQEPVDLVLSDVEMPGMDGFTLTRQIRRTPGWEHVPVVIMTSRGDDADKRAGLDAGASAYLLKSEFDQADLVNTVRRLVGR